MPSIPEVSGHCAPSETQRRHFRLVPAAPRHSGPCPLACLGSSPDSCWLRCVRSPHGAVPLPAWCIAATSSETPACLPAWLAHLVLFLAPPGRAGAWQDAERRRRRGLQRPAMVQGEVIRGTTTISLHDGTATHSPEDTEETSLNGSHQNTGGNEFFSCPGSSLAKQADLAQLNNASWITA